MRLSWPPSQDQAGATVSAANLGDWTKSSTTSGSLTKEALDASFGAIKKQGSTPRHDCLHDGHVLVFNPFGFAACVYCGASEAETARPE